MDQLKDEWNDRRPWFRILLSGRRKIHEGRAFLSKTPKLKNVELIKFERYKPREGKSIYIVHRSAGSALKNFYYSDIKDQ